MIEVLHNWFWLIAAVEIVILFLFYYAMFLFFRGTRTVQVFTGLVVAVILLFGATHVLRLDALHWMLRQLSVYLSIGLLIIFAPEIRRALAELGRPHTFTVPDGQMAALDQIIQAVTLLAQRRIGALIAIEREIGTRAVQETGVKLDSQVVASLLAGIFFPQGPLHDGGVIIRGDRIVAASCLFPVTEKSDLGSNIGMRHRAAIGLTEETDAVVVVVSEETGTVSVSYKGRLSEGLDSNELRKFLSKILSKSRRESPWRFMRSRSRGDTADVGSGVGEPGEVSNDDSR